MAHHALLGSAGQGRIASAVRADYAAAAVLTNDEDANGRILELAGDDAYTLTKLAVEVARQTGEDVAYKHLPPADYEAALLGAGLPGYLTALLADSDAGAARGALFDEGRQPSRLIGRPTTPLALSVANALATR